MSRWSPFHSPYFLYVTLTPRSSSAFGEAASFWSLSQSYSQINVLPSLRVALLETTSNGAVIFQAMRRAGKGIRRHHEHEVRGDIKQLHSRRKAAFRLLARILGFRR